MARGALQIGAQEALGCRGVADELSLHVGFEAKRMGIGAGGKESVARTAARPAANQRSWTWPLPIGLKIA